MDLTSIITNSVHKTTDTNFPTNMDLSDPNEDTDATLLPTYKHGNSFEV